MSFGSLVQLPVHKRVKQIRLLRALNNSKVGDNTPPLENVLVFDHLCSEPVFSLMQLEFCLLQLLNAIQAFAAHIQEKFFFSLFLFCKAAFQQFFLGIDLSQMQEFAFSFLNIMKFLSGLFSSLL